MMNVTAGILAGGKSTRMGQNKALLDRQGERFLWYLIRICDFLPETLISVGYSNPFRDLPCSAVLDERPDFGPLEGIYQLLLAAENPYVLVLAADMPCLEQAFLQRLLACLGPHEDCVVLKSPRGMEPLCGIYGKSVLPVLQEMREAGQHSLRMLLDRVQTRCLTAQDLGFSEDYVARMTSNINTVDAYRRFLEDGEKSRSMDNR